MSKVTIYADGSGVATGGPCGFAAILLCSTARKEITGSLDSGTNNVAEIMAVVMGLEALKTPSNVEVFSDSKYVVNTMRLGWWRKWEGNGWMKQDGTDAHGNVVTWKPVPNTDYWKRLLKAVERHRVTFNHVKGHAGHPLNERCDKLAGEARKKHGQKPIPLAYDAQGNRIPRVEELA